MSKQLLMSKGEFTSWLRRLRMAVMGYVGLILLVGVVYLVAKLIGAEFGSLFVGVVGTIAGLALGAVAWGGLWVAGLAHAQGEQLERQRERIALLESTLQMLEVEIEQKAAVPAAPVPDNAPLDSTYPRIVTPISARIEPDVEPVAPSEPAPVESAPVAEPVAEPVAPDVVASVEAQLEAGLAASDVRAARELWQCLEGAVSPARSMEFKKRLDELATARAAVLREEFVELVRAEQFAAALRKGEEILELVPDSRMSRDFEMIRPHLQARAAESPPS